MTTYILIGTGLLIFGVIGYIYGAAAGLPPIEEEDEHCKMVETKDEYK